MINDVLSNLTGLTIKDSSNIIIQGWHGSPPFNTGCLIHTDNVYSICSGLVIGIGEDDKNNLYSVTVEYNSQIWVRYCLLSSYNVKVGDNIVTTDKIGKPYKNTLRFEYCTSERSDFPIRISNQQLYKHDPSPVVFGQAILSEVW